MLVRVLIWWEQYQSKNKYVWYWKDDEGNWKAYSNDFNDYIQTKYEKKELIFNLKINDKDYRFNLMQRPFSQVNVLTRFNHEVSNEIPDIPTYQWLWQDDHNRMAPYSIGHSKQIEEAHNAGKDSVAMEIKRHVDDMDCNYKIAFNRRHDEATLFCNKSNQNADGIQINLKNKF